MDTLELVARYIAARHMNLVDDPYGHRLPPEAWPPFLDQAQKAVHQCDYNAPSAGSGDVL